MLGDQIKRLRVANNWNQVQLAQQLGISKQSVSNWENNNIVPSIDMLRKICRIFSCSADFLLEMDDEKHIRLDTSGLTVEQAAHIQQIVYDIAAVGTMKEPELSCEAI